MSTLNNTSVISSANSGVQVNDFGGREAAGTSTLQSDGKLLVLGTQGNSDLVLSRYNADGSLDSTFSDSGRSVFGGNLGSWSDTISVHQQADGKVLVVAQGLINVDTTGGIDYELSTGMWRYLPDGSLDTSFGNSGVIVAEADIAFRSATPQGDDSFQLVGIGWGVDFPQIPAAHAHFAFAEYDKDGVLNPSVGYQDPTYSTEFSNLGEVVLSQSDGSFLLLGTQREYAFQGRSGITTTETNLVVQRHNADGSLDTSFADSGRVVTDLLSYASSGVKSVERIQDAVLQSDGKILAVGIVTVFETETVSIWNDNSTTDLAVIRYNSDGSIDTSFATNGLLKLENSTQGAGYSKAVGVSITADNKLMVAAQSTDTNADFVLYRLNTDGSLDSSYGVGGHFTYSAEANALDTLVSHELQADGSVLLVGHSQDDIIVLRITSEGQLDADYAPKPSSSSSDIVDGRTVVTELTTDDRGNNISILSVAPESNSSNALTLQREDDQGNTVLTLSLPDGMGGSDSGQLSTASAHTNARNLTNTITSLGLSAETEALADAAGYLPESDEGSSWFDRVSLSIDSNVAVDEAVQINGISRATSGSDNNQVLVVDASQASSDVEVQINDVGFTVVEHALTMRTDNANQIVVGGTGDQRFYLGNGTDKAYGGGGNDIIDTGAGNDIVFGGAGDDSLSASAGNNHFYGEIGNDTFELGSGQDIVIGGVGTDRVSFSGNASDYNVNQQEAVTYISSKANPSSVHTLVNVEQLSFADQTQMLTYDSNNMAIATLYQQILGRDADVGGFNYWSSQMDQGQQLGDTALSFLRSLEYSNSLSQRYNASFDELAVDQQVEELYVGMLGRSSDSAGKAHWVNAISQGASVRDVATSFAASVELTANYIQADQWNFDATSLL